MEDGKDETYDVDAEELAELKKLEHEDMQVVGASIARRIRKELDKRNMKGGENNGR